MVTVFAKGIPKQNVNIDFGEQIVSIRLLRTQLNGTSVCLCVNGIVLCFEAECCD